MRTRLSPAKGCGKKVNRRPGPPRSSSVDLLQRVPDLQKQARLTRYAGKTSDAVRDVCLPLSDGDTVFHVRPISSESSESRPGKARLSTLRSPSLVILSFLLPPGTARKMGSSTRSVQRLDLEKEEKGLAHFRRHGSERRGLSRLGRQNVPASSESPFAWAGERRRPSSRCRR